MKFIPPSRRASARKAAAWMGAIHVFLLLLMTKPYEQLISETADRTPVELAIGFLRYEALRKLSTHQFAELNARNLKGEFFDDLMDQLIIQQNTH